MVSHLINVEVKEDFKSRLLTVKKGVVYQAFQFTNLYSPNKVSQKKTPYGELMVGYNEWYVSYIDIGNKFTTEDLLLKFNLHVDKETVVAIRPTPGDELIAPGQVIFVVRVS